MTISAIEHRGARPLVDAVRERASQLVQWVARRRLAARTRRELAGLTDLELKDIGITRCVIDDVANGTSRRCGALPDNRPCAAASRVAR